MTTLSVEMCANCCQPTDRRTCRLVSAPITLEAAPDIGP